MAKKDSTRKEIEVPEVAPPPLFGSCRLTIAIMSLMGYFCAIMLTINLGIAIVCINNHARSGNHSLTNQSLDLQTSNCSLENPEEEQQDNSSCFNTELGTEDFYLDKPAQGMLLGALYYSVVCMQLPSGWISDKYGKMKLQMIVGCTLLGIASLLSPVILEYLGVPYFFALRILKGVGMSLIITPILPLQNRWSTPRDHGLLVGVASAGMGIANAVTYPISGFLCQYLGWRSIFYFAGTLGLLWSVLAFFLMTDSPSKHPRISVEEKQYLLSYSQSKAKKKSVVIPWKKILLSIPVWTIIITNFFFFAASKGTVINLPIFITDVLDFDVAEIGIFSALPLISSVVIHLAVGPLFDYVRVKRCCSLTAIRKTFNLIGTIIPAALMFVISQILSPDHQYLIMALITIGYGINEVAWMGGFYFCMVDIAPDYVGTLQGINKSIGLTPGFIIPIVIALLTPNGIADEWSNVFLLFGGLYALAGIVFLLTGSAELQSWGKAKNTSNVLL